MSAIGDMVKTLIEAGTPPDVAAVVVAEAFAAGANSVAVSGGSPVDKVAEKRRAYDRERKANARKSGGSPVESGGSPQEALILKKDKIKKEATKHPLPPDFQPTEKHFEYGATLGYSRDGVLDKFEDLRIWAEANAAKKANWGSTLLGFLRRDKPKKSQAPPPAAALTITPQSRSWNAWKSHFRDTNQNARASIMDKCATDGKPFTVQSEWPPGNERAA